MKIRAQLGMVINLDKCIGCHTCAVTCKQVWTSRAGVEYAWFNNVETKPGTGYPTDWENQEAWQGGWVLKKGKLQPKSGQKWKNLSNIFSNPNLPTLADYYTPFDFNFSPLQLSPSQEHTPSIRPHNAVTGEPMEKVEKGVNWEDGLGGPFSERAADSNLKNLEKEILGKYQNSFMAFLPRLCEHCLNPACVATCPSGAIYKREEDGIVLIDQDKCRGWRMCVSACPYKKIYYNWKSGKSEKCIFCYPRMESGLPTLCSESCVGRIRYLGVMLYDADQIQARASEAQEKNLYKSHLKLFLDPHDPAIIKQARQDGIDESWLSAAQNSPVYKMAKEWKIAFPLHPEFRTLPMVWYIPPLSPITESCAEDYLTAETLPSPEMLRIPLRYLANLLTGGDEEAVLNALKTLISLREFKRSQRLGEKQNLQPGDLSEAEMEALYHLLAIANYEDRFVIPTQAKKEENSIFEERGRTGFHFHSFPNPSPSASRADFDACQGKRRQKGRFSL